MNGIRRNSSIKCCSLIAGEWNHSLIVQNSKLIWYQAYQSTLVFKIMANKCLSIILYKQSQIVSNRQLSYKYENLYNWFIISDGDSDHDSNVRFITW